MDKSPPESSGLSPPLTQEIQPTTPESNNKPIQFQLTNNLETIEEFNTTVNSNHETANLYLILR